MIKINKFWGDLTDISAKKASLDSTQVMEASYGMNTLTIQQKMGTVTNPGY